MTLESLGLGTTFVTLPTLGSLGSLGSLGNEGIDNSGSMSPLRTGKKQVINQKRI